MPPRVHSHMPRMPFEVAATLLAGLGLTAVGCADALDVAWGGLRPVALAAALLALAAALHLALAEADLVRATVARWGAWLAAGAFVVAAGLDASGYSSTPVDFAAAALGLVALVFCWWVTAWRDLGAKVGRFLLALGWCGLWAAAFGPDTVLAAASGRAFTALLFGLGSLLTAASVWNRTQGVHEAPPPPHALTRPGYLK